jgi:NhaA family Na+:H+ antiporter
MNHYRQEQLNASFLFFMAVLAMVISNSAWQSAYQFMLNISLHAINEGLMALFFFTVGLELRREFSTGHLKGQLLFPLVGALGGVIFPILIYLAFNSHSLSHLKGAPIPMATDIAFAIGALGFLGNKISREMRVFLLALATLDDLFAVLVIAIFYTQSVQLFFLLGAGLIIGLLCLCRWRKVASLWIYGILGILLWYFTLKTGVHAAVTGVLLAFFIPENKSARLEEQLKPWSLWFVLPLFAFANAGVSFEGIQAADFFNKVTLGIALGLCIGKPVGILLSTEMISFFKKTRMLSAKQIFIVGSFAGIGFTMSLFLAALSFGTDTALLNAAKIGIFAGSLLAFLMAIIVAVIYPKKMTQ